VNNPQRGRACRGPRSKFEQFLFLLRNFFILLNHFLFVENLLLALVTSF
jgi:hypothetical protein